MPAILTVYPGAFLGDAVKLLRSNESASLCLPSAYCDYLVLAILAVYPKLTFSVRGASVELPWNNESASLCLPSGEILTVCLVIRLWTLWKNESASLAISGDSGFSILSRNALL